MMQVPTSWIDNFDDPAALLKKWEKAVDGVSDLMGFPMKRGKEVLYLQVDVLIRAKAYSPGYPQVNIKYNPHNEYNGNHDHYLLLSPNSDKWKGTAMQFHELGHGHKFQKFPGATEAAVNLPYVSVLNRQFGVGLDEALSKSLRGGHPFVTLKNTAIMCMMTETFKLEKS